MQHESPTALDRAAEMDQDLLFLAAGIDAELIQEIGKRDAVHQLVDDQPHRALGRMGAQKDDGSREPRILHLRHGDEQMPRQITGR